MNNLIRKKINFSLKFLIFLFPITFFIYLFSSDFNNFGNLLFLSKKLFYEISFGIFLISIGYLIRYYRWRIIINSFGFNPLAKTDFKLWLASYAFTATPGKIGELIRCFFLKKIFNIPFKYSFFSVIFERLFDLITVLAYLVCFLVLKKSAFIWPLGKILIMFVIFFILFIFLFKLNKNRKVIDYFYDIKFCFLDKVFKIKDLFRLSNLNKFLRINFLIKMSFLSIISWGLEGISFLLLLRKLDFDISFLTATFIHTSSGLVGAFTFLPGGVGLTELMTVAILKQQTIPIDYGIPITSIIRLMTLWYITILGIISLLLIREEVFKDV